MNDKVNGSHLDPQPLPTSRGTCQQCKFGQVIMGANVLVLTCKRKPPTLVAAVVNSTTETPAGPQQGLQWINNTYWPVVGKDDWCGEWQQDPNAIRSGSLSVLASASDKPS